MISDRGTFSTPSNSCLGNHISHKWICLECNYEMATPVHWGDRRGRDRGQKPSVCPNCGTPQNLSKETWERIKVS